MSGACRSGRTADIMIQAKKAKTYADPQVTIGSKAGTRPLAIRAQSLLVTHIKTRVQH